MTKSKSNHLSVFQRHGVEIYWAFTLGFFVLWAGSLPAPRDGSSIFPDWLQWIVSVAFLLFLAMALRADVVRCRMYDSGRLTD